MFFDCWIVHHKRARFCYHLGAASFLKADGNLSLWLPWLHSLKPRLNFLFFSRVAGENQYYDVPRESSIKYLFLIQLFSILLVLGLCPTSVLVLRGAGEPFRHFFPWGGKALHLLQQRRVSLQRLVTWPQGFGVRVQKLVPVPLLWLLWLLWLDPFQAISNSEHQNAPLQPWKKHNDTCHKNCPANKSGRHKFGRISVSTCKSKSGKQGKQDYYAFEKRWSCLSWVSHWNISKPSKDIETCWNMLKPSHHPQCFWPLKPWA